MRQILIFFFAIAATSCGEKMTNTAKDEIMISRLGQQSISDRNVYSSLDSVSFRATQKYKIVNTSNPDRPQILLANVTQYAGDAVEQETIPVYVPLTDGKYVFECTKYVDIKLREERDWGPIRCEFEPISVFFPDANAALADRTEDRQTKK